jgi:outer membrane lipase/esterase
MTKRRNALLASAVALACSAAPVSAQWSNFIFFGDSLTDAGTYIPVVPPGVGRFTTNPDLVWAQVLGARYGFTITPANQGGTDYAQGGARLALLPGFPNNPPTATALPISSQVAQQIAAGIDPNAVYALWGGGNDILVQLGLAQAGVITSAQAQAAVILAATQYVQQVAALQAAGAQNIIVFNLPDIGQTPAGRAGGAAASAQLSAITGLYNSTVQAGLNALGGNVLRVDIGAFFAEILANPAAFGFANATTPACGTTPSLLCSPANLVTPNANQTFVFADGVHPTGAAHAAISAVVASMIEAPFHTATLTEGPLAVEQATFRAVDARMWSGLNTPIAPKGWNLWASYDFANPDLDFGRVVNGDADVHTFSVGGDTRIGDHWVAGAAAHFSEYKAHYTGGSHKLEETAATLYAGYGAGGPWYVGTSLLIGNLDYKDVQRNFSIGALQRTEHGDTSGWHWAFRVLGGYWLTAGSVLHGPFAKLVWQEAEVSSFSEVAGTATALRYGEQTRKSLIGSLGWQVHGQWGAVRPFGRVTWEYEFKDDTRVVNASPIGIGGTFATTLGKPDNNWALLNLGASMDFGQGTTPGSRVSGYLMGTATAGKDDGDSYAITVGVRVPL